MFDRSIGSFYIDLENDKVADMAEATHRFLVTQTSSPTDGERRASCTVESLIVRLSGG